MRLKPYWRNQNPPSLRVLRTSTTVFLPLVAHESEDHNIAHHEVPPLHVMASSDRTGHSITLPPIANNHTFVADDGGHLDEYWFRSELPNGQLAFTIAITAPMVSLAHIYSDGLLTFPGLEYMHSRHKLSYTSLLQLHLWNINHRSALGCAEIDLVSINGYRIEQNGLPVVLRSGDSTWDTWGIFFPTTFLRFPIASDDGSQVVQPMLNEITVDVDTQQCDSPWAIEVNWGAIYVLPSLNYALFFVHGWTGEPSGFEVFQSLAQQGDYLAYTSQNLERGVLPLDESAQILKQPRHDNI